MYPTFPFIALVIFLSLIDKTISASDDDKWPVPKISDDIETRYIICSLQSSRGESCGPEVIRWHFEQRTQVCRPFTFLGCAGNSNNFPTKDFCNSYCNRACPYDARPLKNEDGGIKKCQLQEHCPDGYTCTEVTVENLKTYYCCPTKYTICNQPPEVGDTCAATTTRYSFNPTTKTCAKFPYKGCNGNSNNFNTTKDCMDFCASTACLPGENAIISKSSVKTCDPAKPNISCADGYSCRHDMLYKRNVCCGSKPRICPDNSRPYLESASTTEARFCEVGRADACPSPYICSPNPDENVNYCCVPKSDDEFCYDGQTLYKNPITSAPKVCRLYLPGDCPIDYKCTAIFDYAIEGYCCKGEPTDFMAFDAQLSDNDTALVKNYTNDLFFDVSNSSSFANDSSNSIVAKSPARSQQDNPKNISMDVPNAAPAPEVNVANSSVQVNVANSSVQGGRKVYYSGKEAFVNLVTECKDDSSCPLGYICQRNATSNLSTCLLVELAKSMTSLPKDQPPAAASPKNESVSNSSRSAANPVEVANATEVKNSSTEVKVSNSTMNNNTNSNSTNKNSTLLFDSPILSNISDDCVGSNCTKMCVTPRQTCITDADCGFNSTCAQTEDCGRVCTSLELLNDIKCNGTATDPKAARTFCDSYQTCPTPSKCVAVKQFRLCCSVNESST